VLGKEKAKENAKNKIDHFTDKIDQLLQGMNYGQTNGIPQGSVLMDFIAEIVLHDIDRQLFKKCSKQTKIKDYHILRYRDDYRIFSNEVETAREILKNLSEVLSENGGMRLSPEKTRVETCVISGSLKKDKLHYFECFKQGDTLRHKVLNIYLFAKKHPNSGSLSRLLQQLHKEIKKEINKISVNILYKKDEVLKYFDPEYLISILSEIMYQHPRTYAVVGAIIFDITGILPNEKRKSIWKNLSNKMYSVPNNQLLRIWLERTVHIHPTDSEGWFDFFDECYAEENKTLLLKAYKKEQIWQFPSKKHIPVLDTSLILDNFIINSLKNAENYQEQELCVNVPFHPDEINPFEY